MFEELEGLVKSYNGMSIYSFCAGDNQKARGFFAAMDFQSLLVEDFYGKGRNAYFLWKQVGRPA